MYLQIHLNNIFSACYWFYHFTIKINRYQGNYSNNSSFQLIRMLLIYLELNNTQLIKNNSQALLFIKIHRISIITPRGWNG